MLSKKEIIFARLTILLTVGLIFLFQADYVQAQEQKTKKPIQVMVLGTFHFTGVPDFYPIKAPERQEEIEAVVDKLKQFNPSKVALEYQRKHHAKLDSMYEEYLEGNHELTVNERQQLGFRTAKQLNHDKVYSIDFQKEWGFEPVINWAEENDPEFIAYFHEWREEKSRQDSILHRTKPLNEILKVYNSEAFLNNLQEARMTYMTVGAGENYVGIQPLSSVYERNMRIFANLVDIAEPGDRVLIIYGSGHSYFFHRFIEQHPQMELVPVQEYL